MSIFFYVNDLADRSDVEQGSLEQYRYRIFSVGAIGTFMATLDGSIVNVALPSIADSLNCGVDSVAWVVLSYALTLISLMLVFGAWVQKRGYSFAYRFGFSFFLAGSLLCSLAPSIYVLVAGRVVQAIGTAMFAAVGPAMVTTVFGEKERGKGLGMMVMMVSAGFMVGPPLGGLMLKLWPWQSIFYINLPIGVLGLYMVSRYFQLLKTTTEDRPLHLTGAVSISTALVTFVLALSLFNDYAILDFRILGLLVVSAIAFVFFIKSELNPESALIGLDLFSNRQFTSSMFAALMHFMSFAGVSVLLPFYLERVKGLEPSQVGLFLIILPILMFIIAPLSGRLSDKIGYRALTSIGMIGIGVGMYLFSRFEVNSPLSDVVVALVVSGLGVGIFNTPNSSAMMGAVDAKRRGVASGILATNRNIGMSVGVAISTTLFAYLEAKNAFLGDMAQIFTASYRPVAYVSMGLAAIGVLFCLVRAEPPKTVKSEGES